MYIIYFQYKLYIHTRLRLASGREMASYNLGNFDMESPAFLSFILNRLSVRKWSFFGKKKLTGIPLYFDDFTVGKIPFGPKISIRSEN